MKKRGNTCDYTSAKNSELVRVFNNLVKRAAIIDLDHIFRQVAESGASRFFISEERAYELVVQYRRTGIWRISNSLRVEMMETIYKYALRLLKKGDAPTIKEAVYMAVNMPAPKFYLTPRSCRTLIYSTIRASFLAARERLKFHKTP